MVQSLAGMMGPLNSDTLEKAVVVADQIMQATSQPSQPSQELEPLIKAAFPGYGTFSHDLDAVRAALAELGKEISFTSGNFPVPGNVGFAVFDLSGPARATYPVLAPVRATIPREKGVGASALAKVVTGISGTGTGGASGNPLNPTVSTNVPLAAGNVEAARGTAISIASADVIVPYAWHALYNAVTWPSFYAGQEFQDLQGLMTTTLLQSAMLNEEREILMGRDATLSAPAAPTGTARAVVGTEVGIVGTGAGGTNVYIKVTAVGPFGETAGSAAVTVNIAAAATRVIDVSITDVTGALAYNVYASLADTGGADPGDASRFFYGTTGFNKFTLGADGRVTSGAVVPTTDTGTGSTTSYRGLIQSIESGPASGSSITGYVARSNAKPSGAAVTQLQNAFISLWGTAKANPDEVWVNARERKNFTDTILATSSSPYRLTYVDGAGDRGIVAGTLATAVMNEATGKVIKLTVHPWLPVGNAVILSYQLPFPTAYGATNAMS